jgi:exodeoxyribonuclease VII large subunit
LKNLELFSQRQILSVSDLVAQLKKHTEGRFNFIWVEGEISGLARPASGHLYFSLKDDKSMLRAVFFRNRAGYLRFKPENGLKVLCQGKLSVYQPRGEVQLVVDSMEPRGSGALALAFEQIKKRLDEEGLFDQQRKKPLPELIRRVAGRTSRSCAAVRDFIEVLHSRFAGIEVAVYPTTVQGDKAPGQIIEALEDLAQWEWPQVIVLTRGGGSPEDLWAFNDENLARAIAECPLPVVSAVGHEIDFTISDFVADQRAATPTAAAELLAQPMAVLAQNAANLEKRLLAAGQRIVKQRRQDLNSFSRQLGDPSRRLVDKRLRLDDLMMRAAAGVNTTFHAKRKRLYHLEQALHQKRPENRLAQLKQKNTELGFRLLDALKTKLQTDRAQLENLKGRLKALGPQAVLNRGYALITGPDGRLLSKADPDLLEKRIDVRLAQGRLKARVEEVDT